ncbi:MAG: SCP2 sterol-binding domain-containing protein [Myxococcales bacterium]
MQQNDPFAPILRRLKGQTDRQILTDIERAGGVEAALDAVFNGMAAAFRPERAGRRELVIQYDIGTPRGTLNYQVALRGGACRAERGSATRAEILISLSLPNFLRLVMGNLRPTLAYLTGKLKISGDLILGAQVEDWFERPV